MPDVPFDELAYKMEMVVQRGGTVWAKWTCKGCGARCQSTVEDVLNTSYIHEECGVETNVKEQGGGFIAMFRALL